MSFLFIKSKLTFALVASLISTAFAEFKAPLPEFTYNNMMYKYFNFFLIGLVWSVFSIPILAAELESELRFETIIMPTATKLPAEGEVISILLALQITNISIHTIKIEKYNTPITVLESPSGKISETLVAHDAYRAPEKGDLFFLQPRHSTYILVDCSIKCSGGIRSIYGTLRDGGYWNVDNIMDGNYKISLHYLPGQTRMPSSTLIEAWRGDVKSPVASLLFTR